MQILNESFTVHHDCLFASKNLTHLGHNKLVVILGLEVEPLYSGVTFNFKVANHTYVDSGIGKPYYDGI